MINMEEVLKKQKQWSQVNKNRKTYIKMLENTPISQKKYYEKNKEEIKEKAKEYQRKKREKEALIPKPVKYYHCVPCDFTTTEPRKWAHHHNTNKHKFRKGKYLFDNEVVHKCGDKLCDPVYNKKSGYCRDKDNCLHNRCPLSKGEHCGHCD